MYVLLPYLIFKTIFISPINSTSTGRIFTLNSPFGSAVAVDERSLRMVPFDKMSYIFISPDHMPISRCFGVTAKNEISENESWLLWQRPLKIQKPRNLVVTSKQREIGKWSENIGNFVFCRMVPSVMTSIDPESQNYFRCVLLLRVRFPPVFV